MMQIFLPPEFCNAHNRIDLFSFTFSPTATHSMSSIMQVIADRGLCNSLVNAFALQKTLSTLFGNLCLPHQIKISDNPIQNSLFWTDTFQRKMRTLEARIEEGCLRDSFICNNGHIWQGRGEYRR